MADPQATIDAAAAGTEVDAWVTFDPWPEIAGFADLPDPDVLAGARPVAATEFAMVVRAGALDAPCEEVPDWSCVVAELDDRVAFARPSTAAGLLVLGWAAAELLAVEVGDQRTFASAELDLPVVQDWLNALDLSLGDPLGEALTLGRTGPLVIGTTAVDAARIAGTREADRLDVVARDRFPTLAVVVAGPHADRVTGEPSFTAALEDLGWALDTGAATTGGPSPGVLFALSQELS